MFRLITFDIYSASLDINGSAIPIVQDVLGIEKAEAETFFKTWRAQQWNYLLLKNSMRDGYKSYRQITYGLLDYMEKKSGIALSEAKKEALMKIWTTFHVWPEAKAVLEQIKAKGYPIAMLSNGDYDMLEPLQESTGIKFDYIFGGNMSGCFKPCMGIYELPYQKLGIPKSEMLHVAGSMFDVMGAKAAGCTCAWSNRYHEPILDEAYKPDFELNNLSELLGML